MTDREDDIAKLIKRHNQGELTDNERNTLIDWVNESDENRRVFNELTSENGVQLAVREMYAFKRQHHTNEPAVVELYQGKTYWFKYILAAAAIIAVVSMVWMFAINSRKNNPVAVTKTVTKKTFQDLAPGGNKAVLTLADGSTIVLDNKSNGVIAEEGKTTINKKEDGQLEYKAQGLAATEGAARYNTISTPRGGQYQLTLPDGSKVWLNAASSLKFPVEFSGKERVVQLTGEAYFEVVHKDLPFQVVVNNAMKVQVLGTHFNIMAYEEEAAVKTTLLQGKVRVENEQQQAVTLQPGEQSLLTSGGLKVKTDPDVAEAVAWKDGKFKFVHADLKAVMRNLARWYDVQIEYDKNVPEKSFSGEISRRLNASEVLSVIEFAGVHFKIEGKKIMVLP
ncbi:hypothetical protein A3860_36535 [Niastella vici]|uniref:Iron dicitrate transport regulator FecR n=1 Tax=Niastella vici TaxID=1703345 RepID=A0A1V9FMW7_9BACT|nr:FecR family protein [Niastella vici]OQP59680.1 hypothetical protein A3860_36535 [Niastella vici]